MTDSPPAGTFQRAVRGHANFRFIALVLGFGFQVAVVKLLSPDGYATYAILLAVLLVGERVQSFGTDRTILRFVPALLMRREVVGLRTLVRRLALVRAVGLCLFVLVLSLAAVSPLRIAPTSLSATTSVAFGAWFVAYALIKDGDAIAQSLIKHERAALIAACEVFARLAGLAVLRLTIGAVNLATVVLLYATTSWTATFALGNVAWRAWQRLNLPTLSTRGDNPEDRAKHREVMPFATSAYVSTLSFLISSPGVVRLVARAGLGVYELAGFSFVQGLASSLAGALPGQLVLPSVESIAGRLADSGERERILPALSLLFKIELACVLAIAVGTAIGGSDLIALLSRSVYAPYYYVLPILIVGMLFQTAYRVIEILGSAHLKYRVFLALWPLSIAAVVALYVSVGRWGLWAVLVIPIAEIFARVAFLTFVFRHHGIWRVLDPPRALRVIVAAAGAVLLVSYGLTHLGELNWQARLGAAFVALIVFAVTLLVARPLRARESDLLSQFIPSSWSLPRSVIIRLSGRSSR